MIENCQRLDRVTRRARLCAGGTAFVALCALVTTTGCTTVQIGSDAPRLELDVPQSLRSVEPMIVTRRFETTFGPYRARRFRGANERWTIPLGDVAWGEESYRLRFRFSGEDGEEREVRCMGSRRHARLGESEFKWRKEGDPPEFACVDAPPSGESRWTVVIWSLHKHEAGYVTFGTRGPRRWQLVRAEAVTPMPRDDRVGFLLLDGEQATAAIELAGRGRVWIGAGLSGPGRYTAAAVAAVLLAYENRRE